MTDLIVTPTEARRNFFNLIKIAESGKRRVYINSKKSRLEFVVSKKKIVKKPSWDDFFGKGSKKVARDILKAKKMVDKYGETKRRLW
ncbi:hypothetical protein HYV64_04970 [Candidatus Shapirobacteria bacterium]|nr:hypothetical protein [Candidatus Shapirobacteria bacterium]